MPDFDGYPLSQDVDSDDPSDGDDYHADLHNDERRAVNQLQDQINDLSGLVAVQTTQISDLVDQLSTFSDVWTLYTPTLTNVTVGTGSVYGRYLKFGRLLVFSAGFKLGSGFTMVNGQPLGISIPFNAQAATDRPQIVYCYAQNASVAWPTSGVGAILSSNPNRISRVGGLGYLNFTPSPWDRNNPQVWASGDTFTAQGCVELASA